MKSSVEELEATKVKLSIEVGEEEFGPAIDSAFKRIAYQVKVPGFRPGKAPRHMVEARIGAEAAREEALRASLPGFFDQAVAEHDLRPVGPPSIDLTAGREEGPVSFDAVVEVVPRLALEGYDALVVPLPIERVTEEAVTTQVDRLREQHAELVTVARPARQGDNVLVDRRVYRHDDTLAVVSDELLELGKGAAGEPLDTQLAGARAGDILKFNAAFPAGGGPEGSDPGDEATYSVLVKEVRAKVLPAADDEWAADASEFETIEELRAGVREQMEAVSRLQAALTIRDRVLAALGDLVTEEIPRPLVMAEMDGRVRSLANRLSTRGIELPEYLAAREMSQDELLEELRAESERAVRIELGLSEVAKRENIEAEDADVETEVARLAERSGRKPASVARRLEAAGEWPALRSGLRKAKAVEWLVINCSLVDEEGQVIEREAVFPREMTPGSEASGQAQTTSGPAGTAETEPALDSQSEVDA
ncbi:MAG: trigger factor [Acidimicrobiales bacterium]